jgi:hypothetical protein
MIHIIHTLVYFPHTAILLFKRKREAGIIIPDRIKEVADLFIGTVQIRDQADSKNNNGQKADK